MSELSMFHCWFLLAMAVVLGFCIGTIVSAILFFDTSIAEEELDQ